MRRDRFCIGNIMNISTREIEYILTVAQEKSISRAAQSLNISQPALSQAILKIEAIIGVPLFIRTKNGIVLTEIGDIFVKYGAEIMGCVDQLERGLNPQRKTATESLRIGVPYYLGSRIMPPFLRKFQDIYPSIQITLIEMASQDLEVELLNQRIDIAVVPLPMQLLGIRYQEIITSRIAVVLSQDNPFRQQFYCRPGDDAFYVDLSSLEKAPFVMLNQNHRTATVAMAMLHNVLINPHISFLTSNFDTLKQLISHNLGIALVPDLYISEEEVDTLRLCRAYLEGEQDLPWTIALAFEEFRVPSSAAQCFAEYMKTWAEEQFL